MTKAAKSIIVKDFKAGKYVQRANSTEPALMAPSTDPSQYSRVRDGVIGPIDVH